MDWRAPPKGTPADRVLDTLGQLGKPDWERACRWCPGWNIARTERLAEQAARGGDPRLAWYVPLLEAEEARSPHEHGEGAGRDERNRGGRPRSDTGWQAYMLKAQGGRTWASIARELGLSDARRGDVAMRMAKRYAKHEGLPWPI